MHEVYVWCYAGGQDVETDCAILMLLLEIIAPIMWNAVH